MDHTLTRDHAAADGLPPAAIWRRLLAVAVDLGLLAPALVALAWIWQALFEIHLPARALPLFDWVIQLHLQGDPLVPGAWLFLGAVASLYFLAGLLLAGTSPGMRLLDLRVVNADGAPPGPAASSVRILGAGLSAAYLGLGFLWILFDAQRQGLHDKIAGTRVVRRKGR